MVTNMKFNANFAKKILSNILIWFISEPSRKGQRIMWQDFKSKGSEDENTPLKHHPIDFDGIPFVSCDELIYDCQHGKDKHESWKKDS